MTWCHGNQQNGEHVDLLLDASFLILIEMNIWMKSS